MGMKLFFLILFCGFCVSFAEREGMTPEEDVKIFETWWGNSFYQKGSQLSTTSMFSVLDGYENSKPWANKSQYIYFPSMILACGGIIMVAVPPTSKALGNRFSQGMFFGGIGIATVGIGLFKLSNIYLTKAVRKYKEDNGSEASHFNLELEASPQGGRLVGNLTF